MAYRVVIGSKPNAVMPVVEAEEVLAANGAIERAQWYRERSRVAVTSVVSEGSLLDDQIRKAVTDARPDRLVVRGTKRVRLDVQLPPVAAAGTTAFMSPREQFQIQQDILGPTIYYGALLERRDVMSQLIFGFEKFVLGRGKPALGCSTGVWSVLLALSADHDSQIVITGIGLLPGEDFYRAAIPFSAQRAAVDRWVMGRIPARFKDRLWTTDESMHRLGGIQLYRES